MTIKKKKEYLGVEDVAPKIASNVLNFLNAAKTAKEISEAIEFPGERDVGIKVGKNILDKRANLGSFTDLKQVADIRQIGPERFTEIVRALGGKNRTRNKEENNMAKKDMEKAKKIIEKFDPVLVAMAVQEIDINANEVEKAKEGIRDIYGTIDAENKAQVMSKAIIEVNPEIINKEVEYIKTKLKGIDKGVIVEVARDYIGVDVTTSCLEPLCICPEGCRGPFIACIYPEGCDYPVGLDIGVRDFEYMDISQFNAMRVIDINKGVSAVVRIGSKLGYAGLCVDTVNCTGKQIWVMHKCMGSLVTLDVGGVINPIDAILKVAETNPILHKRINKMIEKMRQANEL